MATRKKAAAASGTAPDPDGKPDLSGMMLPAIFYTFSPGNGIPVPPNAMWWMHATWLARIDKNAVAFGRVYGHVNPTHNFCGGLSASSIGTYVQIRKVGESYWSYEGRWPVDLSHRESRIVYEGRPPIDASGALMLPGRPPVDANAIFRVRDAGPAPESWAFFPNANDYLGVEFVSQKDFSAIIARSAVGNMIALARQYGRGMIFGVDRISGTSVENAKCAESVREGVPLYPAYVQLEHVGMRNSEGCYRINYHANIEGALQSYKMLGATTNLPAGTAEFLPDPAEWVNTNSGSTCGLWKVKVDIKKARLYSNFKEDQGRGKEVAKMLAPDYLSRVTGNYYCN